MITLIDFMLIDPLAKLSPAAAVHFAPVAGIVVVPDTAADAVAEAVAVAEDIAAVVAVHTVVETDVEVAGIADLLVGTVVADHIVVAGIAAAGIAVARREDTAVARRVGIADLRNTWHLVPVPTFRFSAAYSR